jgi:hypothetical protein
MDLLIYFPHGEPIVDKSQLEHWLKVIYQRVYDCSPDDPRVDQMMRHMSDPVRLVSKGAA